MKRMAMIATGLAAAVLGVGAAAAQCPPDSVRVGRLCVDRYEASVWKIPDTLPNRDSLIAAIQAGMITSAAQLVGAQRRGEDTDDYGNCTDNGGGACTKNYAVSIAGVKPSRIITWFQALAACTSSGKRLLTSQQWMAAALGTPDPGFADDGVTDCNTTMQDFGAEPSLAGSRSACVSSRGAYDMAGNLWEWVAEWVPLSTECPGWVGISSDQNCLAGASTIAGPGALVRGGAYLSGAGAGPVAVRGNILPIRGLGDVGFRCGRTL